MSRWVARWEQNSGERIVVVKHFYGSKEQAEEHIEKLRRYAREHGKHFKLLSLKPVEEREVER